MLIQSKDSQKFILDNCERRVDTGCWLWIGYRNRLGYGRVAQYQARFGERLAHRIAHRAFIGPISGRLVMHTCDTPSCVNPDHLRSGNDAENNADMRSKGRARNPAGTNNAMAKLNEAAAREIRNTPRRYGAVSKLATRFGVSRKAIRLVMDGVTWKG